MVKFFQHRVNHLNWTGTPQYSEYGEIDIQIDNLGRVMAQHDPDEKYPIYVEQLLDRYKSFIVDIKQNMQLCYFDKIAAAFGNKLEGFIDVPYPCASEVRRKYKVFERHSEYEKNSCAEQYYLDPLKSWDESYKELMEEISCYGSPNETIIAAPDLHGVAAVNSLQVISDLIKEYPQIYGIITKHPVEMAKLCCV